ncbi:DNA replication terminus site-binding protein [Microbulbifer yueqingensis]|uniref:DNA replication terminus site binding protein n=1 Tax=Microbulbifer yueqingensis TaxID=658219 RepID=A0A1G9ACI2_9GAMM|nr:DNA replication terminus site-binding protein [Microbulbifer yueqingensis]SDK25069.1 hypothetical protein SAMN05216212_1949 [Microbulbifer yueqingensis]
MGTNSFREPKVASNHSRELEIARLARDIAPRLDHVYERAALLRSELQRLEDSPRRFEHYLLQPAFARDAALQLEAGFDRPFALAGELYAALDHRDSAGGDARTTLQVPGLLAVPRRTIDAAAELNLAKQGFATAVSEFRRALDHRPASERDQRLRELLADAGHPRAHLRQCYRQVLLCPAHPDAIALSWIKARKSIRKVTADWCEQKLVKLDPQGADPGIQYQRQLLAGLDRRQHGDLRQVQLQSRPNLQVAEIFRGDNVQGKNAEGGGQAGEEYRQVGYAAMPVLVLADEKGRLPEFTRVGDEPAAGRRRQRRDLALSREPFLPALRVYLRNSS